MTPMMNVLLFCALASSAYAAPEVPDEALALVPADVQVTWLAEESVIAALDADIEAAESTLAAAQGDTDDAQAAAIDAEAAAETTRGTVKGTRDQGQLEVDVAKSAVGQARNATMLTKLRETQARDGVQNARTNGNKALILEAKSTLSAAKLDDKRAKADLREAKRQRGAARDDRRAGNDYASNSVDEAEESVAVADAAETLKENRQVALRADLALLRTRRELAVVTLELSRAEAAVAAGAVLEVTPFVAALEQATQEDAAARAAVPPLAP